MKKKLATLLLAALLLGACALAAASVFNIFAPDEFETLREAALNGKNAPMLRSGRRIG